MPNIYKKNVNELTTSEKAQIKALIQRYYPNTDDSFINNRLADYCDFDIVMFSNNADEILGVSYYKTNYLKTPFHRQKIPVVNFGMVAKKQGYKGNVVWRAGNWYLQRMISYIYPLKKNMGVACLQNPKAFYQFAKHHTLHYPNPHQPNIDNQFAINYLNYYFKDICQLDKQVNAQFVTTYHNISEKEDVTDDWNTLYKSTDEAINNYCFDVGIFIIENGRIYKTNKSIVMLGYRNVFDWRHFFPHKRQQNHLKLNRPIT